MSLSSLIASLVLSATAHATVIGIDNFDYADGTINGQTGGTGWNNEFTDEAGAPPPTASDWRVQFGSVQVASSALVTDGSGALRSFCGLTTGTGQTTEREGLIRGVGAMFFSVNFTRNNTIAPGNNWSGVSSFDFSSEKIFWGVLGTSNFFAVDESGVGATISTIPVVVGQTYTLIGMLDFDNDRIGLWVDPTPADTASTYDVSRVYTNGNWSTAIRLGSGPNATWDNLKVGTSFAEVNPVPEPSISLLGLAGDALLVVRRCRSR